MKLEDMCDRMKVLGEQLKDRLEPSLVDYALEYIDYSEAALAFETLCDFMNEHDIKVTRCEYDNMLSIAEYFNIDVAERYQYPRVL